MKPELLERDGQCRECGIGMFSHGGKITRTLCGACMKALYEQGYSLREIGMKAGTAMQNVHKLLQNAGTKFRPKSVGMGQRPEERVK